MPMEKKKARRHWDRHQFWFVITEVFSLSHGNLLLTTKSSLLSLRNAATRLRSSKTRRERPAVRWLDRLKTNPQASQRNLEWETKANGSMVTQNVWICIDRHLAQTLFSYTPRAKHRISLLSLTSVLFDSSQVAKIYHHKVCMQNLLMILTLFTDQSKLASKVSNLLILFPYRLFKMIW